MIVIGELRSTELRLFLDHDASRNGIGEAQIWGQGCQALCNHFTEYYGVLPGLFYLSRRG